MSLLTYIKSKQDVDTNHSINKTANDDLVHYQKIDCQRSSAEPLLQNECPDDQDIQSPEFEQESWAELVLPQIYSQEAERILNDKCKQLKCKTTTMTYSRTCVNCIYIMIALICIPLGVIVFNQSQSVIMQEFPAYNNVPACSLHNQTYGKQCIINYTLNYDFTPPIYVYYKLKNFYQNHRSYVSSRNDNQLGNDDVFDITHCDPNDVKRSQTVLYKNEIMLPCGLIANSFFNDKYKMKYFQFSDNNSVKIINFCNTSQCDKNEQDPGVKWSDASWYAYPNWDNNNIAWKTDINERFAATEQIVGKTTDINRLQQWQNITLPNTNDQDLVVWMRTATVSTFTKLHRIIYGQSLKKGSILEVTIKNYFVVNSFNGEKSIVISTNSFLGGKNGVLGICFMIIGVLSLLTCVCFRLFIPPIGSIKPHNM